MAAGTDSALHQQRLIKPKTAGTDRLSVGEPLTKAAADCFILT